jgi:hypothetical protein
MELETTLHRSFHHKSYRNYDIKTRERVILKKFKSRAFQYIQSPPNDKEYIEWFSLIQDHGGPSRLLDFSESFYIASFFALESVAEVGCVWAINPISLFTSMFSGTIENNSRILNGLKVDYGKSYLGESEIVIRYAESFFERETKAEDLVLKVIPPRLNERLAVQKGVFLFPCNIDKSFENNLCKTLEFSFDSLDSKHATQLNYQELLDERIRMSQDGHNLDSMVPVIKINMTKEIVDDALLELHRMNIDYASLFPGLDGFTKSLKWDFDSPITFKLHSPEESH